MNTRLMWPEGMMMWATVQEFLRKEGEAVVRISRHLAGPNEEMNVLVTLKHCSRAIFAS